MHLLIDNYDSFTYNVAQSLEMLGEHVVVRRNDELDISTIDALNPDAITISPGPCSPVQAGISVDVIRAFAGRKPILGICLGHQCIAAAFGGRVVKADLPYHGKSSPIRHSGAGIFENIPQDTIVGRYHSLIVEAIPDRFDVIATVSDGSSGAQAAAAGPIGSQIMGLAHRDWPICGLQFHPESILTEHGMAMMENFVRSTH